jgi:hypothetical protein
MGRQLLPVVEVAAAVVVDGCCSFQAAVLMGRQTIPVEAAAVAVVVDGCCSF